MLSASKAALAAALAVTALAGCTFKPRIPDAVISCSDDSECPAELVCAPKIARCCRPGSCGDLPNTEPAPGRTDAGRPPQMPAAAPDAAPEAEPAEPEPVDPPDAGLADASPRADGADAGPAVAVSCAGTDTVPDLGPGRQAFCTIYARATEVGLSIHSMVPGDAVSARTYGVCSARVPLFQEASDSGIGRPISAGTIQQLVDATQQYKDICARHQGKLVGLVANQWARVASNVADVRQQVKAATGLELDVPTIATEVNHLYLGVTRQRRGRVMVLETTAGIDLLYWPKDATSVMRTSGTVSWTEVESMYVANPSHLTFADARRALRGRLVRELAGPLGSIRTMVAAGTLEPGFVMGPADAMVPLAVRGGLRDARGTWDPVPTFEKKRAEALVSPSPYGRIFGAAPLAPGEIDGFFGTLDDNQWGQLRSEPRRAAYGYELFFVTVVLDVLADETKATEFAFVYASAHLGYLFAKVLPPPL